MELFGNQIIQWMITHTSDVLSIGAIVWAGFTYTHQTLLKKKMEKFKFPNQQDLETFKLYTKQKNEVILELYSAMDEMIEACWRLQSFRTVDEINLGTCSEEEFIRYLKNINVTDAVDVNGLLEKFRMEQKRGNVNVNAMMDDLLYAAVCNSYVIGYKHMQEYVRKSKLYLDEMNFLKIDAVFEKVTNILEFEKSIYFFRALSEGNKEIPKDKEKELRNEVLSLHHQFNLEIVPMLKKELWDETKNG